MRCLRAILVAIVLIAGTLPVVNTSTVRAVEAPGGGSANIPCPPNADAGGPYDGNVGEPIYFDGSGSTDPNNDIVSYVWHFGDGTTGYGEYVSHVYSEPGVYNVTLTVTDSQGLTDTDITTATIIYNPPTITSLYGDPNPTYPEPSGWAWTTIHVTISDGVPDFTYVIQYNGNTVTETTSERTISEDIGFDEPGNYTVTVTVTDSFGYTAQDQVVITVLDDYFEVDANGPYFGHPGVPVEFHGDFDYDPGDIVSAEWHFGDGETAYGEDVTHTYSQEGIYNVTFEVRKLGSSYVGTDTTTATVKELHVYIDAPSQAPALTKVGFNIEVVNAFGSQVRYDIDFGDGETTTVYGGSTILVNHTYGDEGTYNFTVVVTDMIDTTPPYHNAQITACRYIQITPAGLYPDAGGPYYGYEGEEIQFDGSNSYTTNGYPIVSYEWDFGDGTVGYGVKPTHVYNSSGDYTVTLTVTNSIGQQASDTTEVTVYESYTGVIADAGKSYIGVVGQPIQFDASNSKNAWSYEWDFGDGTVGYGVKPTHVYNAPGEYTVILTAKRLFEKSVDIATVTVLPPNEIPSNKYVYGGCFYQGDVNETITFHATGNDDFEEYIWDFGDGTVGYGKTVTHRYEKRGTYLVTLTAKDSKGNVYKDVLHTDIGGISLSTLYDFLTTFGINAGKSALKDFAVYIRIEDPTTGEKIEKTIPVDSFPVHIDVNGDGQSDLTISRSNKIGIDRSSFSRLWVIVFRNQWDVSLQASIPKEADFEVDIQFSVADWIMDIVGSDIEDNLFRIGYHSAPGETKPSHVTLKHTLVPYLIRHILNIQPDKTLPEFWSSMDVSGVGPKDSLSLVARFYATKSGSTTERVLSVHYDPVVPSILQYRRGKHSGKWIRELGFARTRESTVTFTYSKREDDNKWANVSFLIRKLHELKFKLEITPLAEGGGSIEYHSTQPLDIILFTENYDEQRNKTTYFYVKNLPTDLSVEWDPSPKNGYIDASTSIYKDLDIGLTDNLDENLATWKINITNLPEHVHLIWDISKAGQISLQTVNTGALSLNYYGWNKEKNRTINFHVETENDLDVTAAWDLDEGWFEIVKSPRKIDFSFSVIQTTPGNELMVNLNGSISIQPGNKGLTIDFKGVDEGVINITKGPSSISFSVGLKIIRGPLSRPNLTVNVDSIGLMASSKDTFLSISWDDTPSFRVDVSTGASIEFIVRNFTMANRDTGFFMHVNSIQATASSSGYGHIEITWNEQESELHVGGGGEGRIAIKGFTAYIPRKDLSIDWDLLEIGASAYVDMVFGSGSLDIYADAMINVENLSLSKPDWYIYVGKFYLGGSGEAHIKKIENQVRIEGSIEFMLGYLTLQTEDTCIQINGLLHINAEDSVVVFDREHIEFQHLLSVSLKDCEFVVEGENIVVEGEFNLDIVGNFAIYWGEDIIKIASSSDRDCRLDVENFFLEYKNVTISCGNITLYRAKEGYLEIVLSRLDENEFVFVTDREAGFSVDHFELLLENLVLRIQGLSVEREGSTTIKWGEEISLEGNRSFDLSNFYVEYGDQTAEIIGSVHLEGENCYLHLKKGHLEIGRVPSVSLNCIFVINGDFINISGEFSVESPASHLYVDWKMEEGVNVSVGASVGMTVSGLYLEYHELTTSVNEIELDVAGSVEIRWSEKKKTLSISGSASFSISDLLVDYSTSLQITGDYFSVGGEGEINISNEMLYSYAEAFLYTREIDVTTPTLYLHLDLFNLSGSGEGEIIWGESLYLCGSVDMDLSNLTIDSESIDATVSGYIHLNAGGYMNISSGHIEMSITGTIDFGAWGDIIINGESMVIGGTYQLDSGDGIITIDGRSDKDFEFTLEATGGPTLTVNNFLFIYGKWNLSADPLTISTEGGLLIHVDKEGKHFNLSGGINFAMENSLIRYEEETILTADLLAFGGGGFFDVKGGLASKVKLFINLNLISVENLHFEPPESWDWNVDHVDIGYLNVEVNAPTTLYVSRYTSATFYISGGISGSISLTNLDLLIKPIPSKYYRRVYLKVGGFSFDGGISAKLGRFNGEPQTKIMLYGSGSISNFQFDFDQGTTPTEWHASLGSASASADLYIQAWFNQRWYWINGSASLDLSNLYISYSDAVDSDYDSIVSVNSLYCSAEGYARFFLRTVGSEKPYFRIGGSATIDCNNLQVKTGEGTSEEKKVIIPSLYFDGNGELYVKWDEEYLRMDGNIDVEYDLQMITQNYGTWHASGHINGDATLEAYWNSAQQTGQAILTINSAGDIDILNITHDQLTLDIGSLHLSPGTITFEWDRGDTGYFDIIDSGVSVDMELCKILYPPDEFEFKLGEIQLRPGTTHIEWQKNTSTGYVYVDNGITFDATLIKVKWGDKAVELGNFELKSGEFRLEWDTSDPSYKEVRIRNGIPSLRGGCSFQTGDQIWTLSVLQFESDYSKTITFGWYKSGSSITGLYLDTGGIALCDWVEFQVLYGDTGRKLKISGPKAEGFYIKKENGKLVWGGSIKIGNQLTYSKLVNGDWKDLHAEWNIVAADGYIQFDIDPYFTITINISIELIGANLEYGFDPADHIFVGWDINGDGAGYVALDTNNESVGEYYFSITKDADGYHPKWGILVIAHGFAAEDFQVSWDLWPPSDANITVSGDITAGWIECIKVCWKEQWYQVWPL